MARRLGVRCRLPLDVGFLVLYELAVGATLVRLTAFPLSPEAPRRLTLAFGVVAGGLGLLSLIYWRVLSRRLVHFELAVVVVSLQVLIARAHTFQGAALASLAVLLAVLYAAIFFDLWTTVVYGLAAVTGLGIALRLGELHPGARNTALLVVGVVTVAAVFSALLRRFRDEATLDPLTGLLNRGAAEQGAEREVARATRDGRPLSLVVLDIDGLKAVNDSLGHLAGDGLLRRFAAELKGSIRACDLAARYGGDEFVLVLPSTDRRGATVLLDRLRSVRECSWSAGIAQWRSGEDYASWFARADAELYEAKAGRSPAGALSRLVALRPRLQ